MSTVTIEWTLCDIEDRLIALTESMETVTPDREQEFLKEFSTALTSAAEKRIGWRIIWHTSNSSRSSRQRRSSGSGNSKRSVSRHRPGSKLRVVLHPGAHGKDKVGKYKRLEGNTTVVFLRGARHRLR